VSFAEPYIAMDKQWVVYLSGILCHGHAGGVGETIAGAGNEIIESKITIQGQVLALGFKGKRQLCIRGSRRGHKIYGYQPACNSLSDLAQGSLALVG
jgi:hypothetical protein